MKFVKTVNKKKITFETDNENLYSIYERDGFERVKEPIEDDTEEGA